MRTVHFVIAAAMFIAMTNLSLSRSPGPGWVSRIDILVKLRELGYGRPILIEPTKLFWKVIIEKNGKFYNLNFNPYKAEIVEMFRTYDTDEIEDEDETQDVGSKCDPQIGDKCKSRVK